jgi:triosephosphate isomerase
MRKKFIAGNWKMFTSATTSRQLAAAVVQGVGKDASVSVAVCPPFPYLLAVADVLKGSPVQLGAQNCFFEKEGAYTGEVSPLMLVDVGCRYVIVGHSERRHKLGETDAVINRKLHAALAVGLHVILCVGETLEERERDQTEQVLDQQLSADLQGLAEMNRTLTIAYEPVWAIGTGRNATPDQAQEAHAFIRSRAATLLGTEAAGNLTIQYGGSVKPDNAASLLSQPDVDGALVGGASLSADQFMPIVYTARS